MKDNYLWLHFSIKKLLTKVETAMVIEILVLKWMIWQWWQKIWWKCSDRKSSYNGGNDDNGDKVYDNSSNGNGDKVDDEISNDGKSGDNGNGYVEVTKMTMMIVIVVAVKRVED